SVKYLLENKGMLRPKVYDVPYEVDSMVAKLKLKSMGIEIDELTEEQKKYLSGY
ncbi:MAG: adenosylhomocysteinase, partial [Ignisphaera sp.]